MHTLTHKQHTHGGGSKQLTACMSNAWAIYDLRCDFTGAFKEGKKWKETISYTSYYFMGQTSEVNNDHYIHSINTPHIPCTVPDLSLWHINTNEYAYNGTMSADNTTSKWPGVRNYIPSSPDAQCWVCGDVPLPPGFETPPLSLSLPPMARWLSLETTLHQ